MAELVPEACVDQEVDGGDDRREEVEGVFPQGDGEDHCGVA